MSATPLKRIRDLLSLARSPEKHEADLARRRADELIRRYGLTEDALIEQATETTSMPTGLNGNQRSELGRIVARSRGVATSSDQNGNHRFVGYPEAARDARELFLALVRIVESHGELSAQTESDRLLWRTCFWLGFVASVHRQLDPENSIVPREALAAIFKKAQVPRDVEHAAQAFDSLRGRSDTSTAERFKQLAYDTGFNLGNSIQVPHYRGKRR